MTATSFVPTSDRNAKENFKPVSPRAVLDKVAALPITRWNFKEDTSTEHIGPMAQDFSAAFEVGEDDRHISTVDESGVALAAIQALHEIVNTQNLEMKEKSGIWWSDATKHPLGKHDGLPAVLQGRADARPSDRAIRRARLRVIRERNHTRQRGAAEP